MAVNALIAQGIRPIGADVPDVLMGLEQVRQGRQRNALAQQSLDANIQQDQSRNALYERQIGVQERGQENALNRQKDEQMRQWAAGAIEHARRDPNMIPMLVKEGKAQGFIPPEAPDTLAPEQVEQIALQLGIAPREQFAGSIDQQRADYENKLRLQQIQETGRQQRMGQTQPKPNWQRVEQPTPDGKVQVGFVDMNSPSPDQTFKPFGAATAGKPGQELKDATGLRKEFDSQPIVKDYRQVITLYQRASSAPNTRAGDLSVVYALGKIFDPGSVVREGELHMSANAAPWLQKTLGQAQSQIKGSGSLRPEVRAELLAAMRGQVESIGQQYGQLRQQYSEYANNYNVDPTMVIGKDPTPESQTNGPTKISGDADYAKLPSGAQYIAPDGSTRTKR